MSGRQLAVVFGAVLAVLAVIIVLLVTGGGPQTVASTIDGDDDVAIAEGPGAPQVPGLADIAEARVERDGGRLVFHAAMTDPVPAKLPGQSLSWRWDLYEDGAPAWVLTITIDPRPVASLRSTESGFGASTADGTLDGEIAIDGRHMTLTFDPSGVKDLPGTFTWQLHTTLDGDLKDPGSALATDTAPDGAFGEL